jgi:hypothetical protein
MKTKHILILLFLNLLGPNLFGHEQIVHQAITASAAASALNNSPAFAGFINVVSPDIALKVATNFMVEGSYDEDFAGQDAGGNRSYNHFYDPLGPTNGYGKGLSDAPFVGRVFIGKDSLTWASTSNCLGHDFISIIGRGSNIGTSNIWSWQNARAYEWLGLTATDKLVRQTNLDNMFRAVGQVMHLLEDASQPQHVRNEQHVFPTNTWLYRNFDPFISPIEEYGKKNYTNLNYGNGSMLDWQGAGFTKLEDFWDRHFYTPGNVSVLNADNSENPNGGPNTLGLAEWCNGNFLGDRHLFPEYYKPGDIEYYPYPSRDHSTDYNTVRANPSSGLHPLAPKNGPGNGIYLHKNADGVDIQYLSRVNFLGAKLPNANLKGVPYCTIRDDNVLSNYHNVFIPKAVKYCAGLLDYFFRGDIEVSVQYDSGQYYVTILNDSGQDFSGGAFSLYQDDASENRTLVQPYDFTGETLSDGDTTTFTFSGPVSQITKFTLVYQGTILTPGDAPDPVDEGIGIAVKAFTLDPSNPDEPCTDCICIPPGGGIPCGCCD